MDYIDTLLIMEDDLDEDEDLGEFGQSSTGQPTLTTSRPMTQDSENQDQAVASVSGIPAWCVCGRCRPTPQEVENISVNWWQQAVRSFITPYGKAKEAPEPGNIFKRLQPFTCEWLTRPEYALSEFSDTITSNIPILQENSENYIDPSFVEKLQRHFQPMLESMKALDNKTTSNPTEKDAKKVLKSLVTDSTLDADMDRMFQLSSALFAISSNYLISTALVRHPKQFSALIEGKRNAAAVFKQSGSAQAMKEYILATYQQGDELSTASVSKAASEDVSNAFQENM